MTPPHGILGVEDNNVTYMTTPGKVAEGVGGTLEGKGRIDGRPNTVECYEAKQVCQILTTPMPLAKRVSSL